MMITITLLMITLIQIISTHLFGQGCSYTLWHLEPCLRKQWLEAMLVLVYKYNFSEPDQLSEKVIGLIRIMINSLAAHVHICSKYSKTEGVGLAAVRSQELSEASNGNGNVGPAGTLQVSVFLEFPEGFSDFFRISIILELFRAVKTTRS